MLLAIGVTLVILLQADWLPTFDCKNEFINWILSGHCGWVKERDEIIIKIREQRTIAQKSKAQPALVALKTYFVEERQPSSKETAEKAVAVLFANGDRGVMVIHGQYDTAETKICASKTARCKRIREALSDARAFYARPPNPTRITIIGHADLQGAGSGSLSAVISTACQGRAREPNDCIALARAYDVKTELESVFTNATERLLDTDYDPDPFMATTNEKFGGSLYAELKIRDRVADLKKRLGIGADWTAEQIKADPGVRGRLRAMGSVRDELSPFRSVVIIFQNCNNATCS
jgi:hypothetical protein